MTNNEKLKLSKTISYALRHRPEEFRLQLDKDGWTEIDGLLRGIKVNTGRYANISRNDIEEIVSTDEKQRYEIKGNKIRAVYGHSLKQKIDKSECIPPDILYHGTTQKYYNIIKEEGLKPMSRQYVHYSTDIETATEVALRRTDKPILLKIDAKRAYEEGNKFYEESTGIYLGNALNSKYIKKI